MENKLTIYDIANQLNISTTTVFRALNGKGRVSEETKNLVLETAQKMGFKANKAASGLARNTIKLGLIAEHTVLGYSDQIIEGAKAAIQELSDFNVSLEHYMTNQPAYSHRQEILDKMKDMKERGFSGILVIPSPDKRGYIEVIQELSESNVAVATIGSDIAGSRCVFSLTKNSFLTGKLAAELLWWMTNTKNVAVFTSYKDIRPHVEVIDGFIEGCKQYPLKIVDIFENHDDPELAYYSTEKLLEQFPDVEGIYVCTANSSGVCKKIKEKGYGGKIKIVTSDMFPELKQYMMEDIVHASIFQDPVNQGRYAVKYMFEYITEGKKFDGRILFKPQVIFKSIVDLYI